MGLRIAWKWEIRWKHQKRAEVYNNTGTIEPFSFTGLSYKVSAVLCLQRQEGFRYVHVHLGEIEG